MSNTTRKLQACNILTIFPVWFIIPIWIELQKIDVLIP